MSARVARVRFGIRAVLIAMALIGFGMALTKLGLDTYRARHRASLESLGSGGALLVADGEVVLIRQGNAYGAISFHKQTVREDADFEWRYRNDGRGSLDRADPAVRQGAGHTSRHGGTVVTFGPFAIEWSGCTDGYGWLYHHANGESYLLCPLGPQSMNLIDAADAKWQYTARPQSLLPAQPRGLPP